MRSRLLDLHRLGPSAVVAAIVLLYGSSILAPTQGDPLPKIGYLGFGAATPPTFFQKRMRELGYSEGKDVEVEYRFADGLPEKLPVLARELVDAKVNVIVAIGDEAIVAAKNATRTIPIAMVACDAVTTGFVASLAQSGRQSDGGHLSYLRAHAEAHGSVPRAFAVRLARCGHFQPGERQQAAGGGAHGRTREGTRS
jgi:putative tryptophan/tyrosine transport system substrate-binding protein